MAATGAQGGYRHACVCPPPCLLRRLRPCRSRGRPRAERLSRQARARHRAVRSGRRRRRDDTPRGPEAQRAHGSELRYRQPTRSRRHRGGKGGDVIASRRLYALSHRQRHGDQPIAVQDAALQRGGRLYAGRTAGGIRDAARHQGRFPIRQACRPGRLRKGQSWQAQLRGHQRRQHAEPFRRAVPHGLRCAGHARDISHHARSGDGDHARRCGSRFRLSGGAAPVDRRQADQGPRHLRPACGSAVAGRSDRQGERLSGLSRHELERPVRAGGHADGNRNETEQRDRGRPEVVGDQGADGGAGDGADAGNAGAAERKDEARHREMARRYREGRHSDPVELKESEDQT